MESKLHLKNNINDVPSLGDWMESLAKENFFPEERLFQLSLALEEAVVNVMNYAYPGQEDMPVDITAKLEEGRLTFTIDDHGVPFDPTQKEDPDITLGTEERPIGGLGILLYRQIMDDVSYQRLDGHNILTLSLNI